MINSKQTAVYDGRNLPRNSPDQSFGVPNNHLVSDQFLRRQQQPNEGVLEEDGDSFRVDIYQPIAVATVKVKGVKLHPCFGQIKASSKADHLGRFA